MKQQSCQNNTNKSYTKGKAIHEPFGYAINLATLFDSEQNEQSFYRGRDCIERFCCKLKELGTRVFNYGQREMIRLTNNENKYYEDQKKCYICNKKFCYDKIIQKG